MPLHVAVLLLALTGCESLGERIDGRAAALGFQRSITAGASYQHLTYRNQHDSATGNLHVYVENDGEPWWGRYGVAGDPTPERPVMLELMALDSAPAAYLGRPCYFGMAGLPPCTPLMWTHERYSEAVVDSMAAALRRVMAARRPFRLIFFGHSGGGALAVLMAARFPETVAVVTLAGNLDVHAWAQLHRYTPLQGSLNPVDQPPLPPWIVQKHYVGTRDRNVTPSMLWRYAERNPRAQIVEIPEFDHECCWRSLWAGVLQDLEVDLAR